MKGSICPECSAAAYQSNDGKTICTVCGLKFSTFGRIFIRFNRVYLRCSSCGHNIPISVSPWSGRTSYWLCQSCNSQHRYTRLRFYQRIGWRKKRVEKPITFDKKKIASGDSTLLGEALCNASEVGHLDEVKKLLTQDADPNYETGPKHANPLLLAAHKGHANVARILIEFGADVNKANTDGLTPLIAASMNDHVETVKLLCQKKADPDSQTFPDKYTALMFAKSKEVFKSLLESGASTVLRNKWGDTVHELAQAHGNNEFIRLLDESKKGRVDSVTEQKVRNIKEMQLDLYSSGDRFEKSFGTLFSFLRDEDPEIKTLASLYLAQSPASVDKLISIYRALIETDPCRAVQAGRALGRKLSRGQPEMIAEDTTAAVYGIRVAFTVYSCSFCGKFNIGIPVSTRWLSFYGQKDSKGANHALPVLCDFCNKEFYLCWD
jgi:hypothetical protein